MSLAPDNFLIQTRRKVAQVLLEQGDNATECHRITQRDISILANTDWETVHASLNSLQEDGAIKFERHRIIINKNLLKKMAEVIERIQS